MTDSALMTLHGSQVSYFTGKLEGALRYKELPYRLQAMNAHAQKYDIPKATGVFQMPALQLGDGRWLTDSTPIIAWLDREFPAYPLVPTDPLLRFFSLLVEDYTDEWLWRPAMHYRWFYAEGAALLSRQLANELADDVFGPAFVKQLYIRHRQRRFFTTGDGVDAQNIAHVEGIYLRTLATLEKIFSQRPYLLGDRPSLADIGLFGPLFRHFSMDPVPAKIMRATAPATYLWVARLWAERGSKNTGELLTKLPDDWGPLLDDIGNAYLPYLVANANAVATGAKFFDCTIQGARYRKARTSRYRVWCLEQLQAAYRALDSSNLQTADAILQRHACLSYLQATPATMSGHDVERLAPFCRGLGMLELD